MWKSGLQMIEPLVAGHVGEVVNHQNDHHRHRCPCESYPRQEGGMVQIWDLVQAEGDHEVGFSGGRGIRRGAGGEQALMQLRVPGGQFAKEPAIQPDQPVAGGDVGESEPETKPGSVNERHGTRPSSIGIRRKIIARPRDGRHPKRPADATGGPVKQP